MKVICYILLLICPIINFSQIKGVVYSESEHIPVPYVNVHIEGTRQGCVTNSNGTFEIKVQEKYSSSNLIISHLGFESMSIPISKLNVNDTLLLKERVVTLAELSIYNRNPPASEIIRIAMNKFPKLGVGKPYELEVFYRHYCSEADVYGRLIEAAVVLTDNKGNKKKVSKPSEKMGMHVLQLRQSFDFTQNFDEHEPISVFSTLKYDAMSYVSVLDYYPDDYHFALVDTSYFEGNVVWVIKYNYDRISRIKGDSTRTDCEGTIFINAADYGVLKIEENQTMKLDKLYESQSMDISWQVIYQKVDGLYVLSYISETSNSVEELRSTQQEIVQVKNHKAHVEMMVNNVRLFDVDKNTKGEPSKQELDNMSYDSIFWNDYTVLQSTPLDQQIVLDLTIRKDLESQFKGN
ncbi:MAG: carboxypeptidase-like regulatory domain-containing protein [Flavobacteriales bacterium]|nr:carboxypeptidase-like regulatory domain-containing protein [Flavobacteriales bacterium]